MARTAEDLVRSEVYYCVSSLVSTLAQGESELAPPNRASLVGGRAGGARPLSGLVEQAFDLCAPIADYEEAALQAGWVLHANECDYIHLESEEIYNNVETLCDIEDIAPYDREVFEHWIVSDWLADKLEAEGEKVDKDFAGMTVWARTTTGQGIASDYVIEQIAADPEQSA